MYQYISFDFRCCCRHFLNFLEDIEKGKHDDEMCKEYRKRYKDTWGQEIGCQFKENSGSKIKNLIKKITIPSDESTGNSETSNGEDQKLEHFEYEDNEDDQELKSTTCCFIC